MALTEGLSKLPKYEGDEDVEEEDAQEAPPAPAAQPSSSASPLETLANRSVGSVYN